MSYPANAEQGQRMIDAAIGNSVAPAGDVTKNRSTFNAEQAETLIEILRNGSAAIIKGQQRQIIALRNLLEGVAYSTETDTTAAYAKKVPSGAQAVSINSIGGHSETVDDETVSAEVTDIVCLGKNIVDINETDIVQHSLDIGTSTTERWGYIFTVPVDGMYYLSSDNVANNISIAKKVSVGLYERLYTLKAGAMSLPAGEYFMTVTHTSTKDPSKTFFLNSGAMVEYGSSATDYAPYRGEVDRISLPDALLAFLADKGYGQSPAEGNGNTLDLESKTYTQVGQYVDGEWSALESPVVYDVSGYLPGAGNLLSVESGGMLMFMQSGDTELSVPQSLTWAIKNSEVTA